MKVASIHLNNFKRFGDLHIEVRNSLTKDIANQFLLLGDNGTGKTTVLQAVALCLSLATGQTKSVKDFAWPGWVPGRYERWGRPVVELEVHFSRDEIDATREAARRNFDSSSVLERGPGYVPPGVSDVVKLRLEGGSLSAAPSPYQVNPEILQFRGRWFVSQLLQIEPTARDLFERLPGVYWFDQFRTLATVQDPSQGNGDLKGSGRAFYEVGVAGLRQDLNRWLLSRLSRTPAKRDFLQELERSYSRIFPGRSFSQPEPIYRAGVPSPDDYYFMIDDGNRTYDIEEMSAGEQAVFPMLFEFVRQQIRNSVVLIDEIDLNLHPPLAQAILSALPALGPGCQFFLTTHSEAISGTFSPHRICRLAGGKLCL